jgi:hypothetical protein
VNDEDQMLYKDMFKPQTNEGKTRDALNRLLREAEMAEVENEGDSGEEC